MLSFNRYNDLLWFDNFPFPHETLTKSRPRTIHKSTYFSGPLIAAEQLDQLTLYTKLLNFITFHISIIIIDCKQAIGSTCLTLVKQLLIILSSDSTTSTIICCPEADGIYKLWLNSILSTCNINIYM